MNSQKEYFPELFTDMNSLARTLKAGSPKTKVQNRFIFQGRSTVPESQKHQSENRPEAGAERSKHNQHQKTENQKNTKHWNNRAQGGLAIWQRN